MSKKQPADPLVTALQDAAAIDNEGQGQTTAELAEKLNLTLAATRDRLKALATQGRLMVGRKQVRRFDGVAIHVKSFWIKPA